MIRSMVSASEIKEQRDHHDPAFDDDRNDLSHDY
jgi:hypothetical protein